MVRVWKKRASERICDLAVASVRRDIKVSPATGEEHPFFVVESHDWINVIPFVDERRIILIKQFRHGTDEITLEIPGGMLDAPGEAPEEAAARELAEETGHICGEMRHLGFVHPNPALQNNRCHTFVALRCRKAGEQALDGLEEIDVLFKDIGEIPDLILGGEITHSLVVAAFTHYFLHLNKGGIFGKR